MYSSRSEQPATIIRAKGVYNSAARAYIGQVVLLSAGRIARIGDFEPLTAQAPDAAVLDYSGFYLLPGLINTHVHLEFDPTADVRLKYITGDPGLRLLMAAHQAEAMLLSGVTTARDAGSSLQLLALQDPAAGHDRSLPRLQLAGPPITRTGGHLHFIPGSTADSPDELVQAVEQRRQAGCTAIKIIASGGQLTPGSLPEKATYSAEEIRLVTAAAERWGLPTFAHCLTTESMLNAWRGGVQCLEHCACFVRNPDNQLLERIYETGRMAEMHGPDRFFMSAISNNYHAFDHCRQQPELQTAREAFLLEQEERNCRIFRKLAALGLQPVVGTDAGCASTYFDETWLELDILNRRCGLAPAEVIQAATVNGAAALGLSRETGQLAPGLSADIIALPEDPLRDIGAFRQVGHVILRGQVVR